MLARYQIARGVPASALPRGPRQDTRTAMVTRYLAAPTRAAWTAFARAYRALLAELAVPQGRACVFPGSHPR